jgi:hypothetical protein
MLLMFLKEKEKVKKQEEGKWGVPEHGCVIRVSKPGCHLHKYSHKCARFYALERAFVVLA